MEKLFLLGDNVTFLNHGSYGAMPQEVADEFQRWHQEKNQQPVHFYTRTFPKEVQRSLAIVSGFLGADVGNVFFVRNATTGVNTILTHLPFQIGTILTTDHKYNAVSNALQYTAEKTGLRVQSIAVGPFDTDEDVVKKFAAHLTADTRLIVVDHIASLTSRRFPIEQLRDLAHRHGIQILVDAAHTPGQCSVHLEQLGVDYWTGNCHKWLCAPQGSAVLYVAPAHQKHIHPNTISHGYKQGLLEEFHWLGTDDYIPWLCVPKAIELHNKWGGNRLMKEHHELLLQASERLVHERIQPLNTVPNLAMRTFLLPSEINTTKLYKHLQNHRFECVVDKWGERNVLRISCFAKYNHLEQYQRLATVLHKFLDRK